MHLAGTRSATESTAGSRRRGAAETRARRRPTFRVTELEGLERPATRAAPTVTPTGYSTGVKPARSRK